MSKLRIHELGKEIEKDSKEIIDVLKNKGVEVKNHMSTLDSAQVEMVKNHYNPKPVQAKNDAAPVSEADKKKRMVRVFNPQNSKSSQKQGMQRQVSGQKPAGQKSTAKPATSAAAKSAATPTTNTTAKPATAPATNATAKPAATNTTVKPAVTPTTNTTVKPATASATNIATKPVTTTAAPVETAKPVTSQPTTAPRNNNYQGNRPQGERPQGERPYNNRNNYQGNRPQGERPQGDRPYNNNRNNYQGNNYQGNRPQGDRPQGDRPYNNNNRNNYQGNRPQGDRPQGDRPYNNNRNNYQGNRPQGDRPQGDRPYNNNYRNNNNGDRPNNGYRGNQGGPGGDRRNSAPAKADSIVLEQKPTRAKSNKMDYAKKKDYSNKKEDKAPRNAKGKIIAPVQRPQKKVEVVEKIKMITLPETLTIGELAEKMKIVSSTIIKKLFLEGKIVTVNHELTYEAAEEIALEYEILCEKEVVVDVIEELLKEDEENEETMVKRPPVICVMGHVDHGKTSLLDKIRSTSVTDREAGGITQHIGAYVTQVGEEKITFLDTPGHEAFTAMRMRGASSTDIAILVVAADDGVMPQTVEAINHAKAAGIEIIVAVNKIDKPGANIERVKQELTEYELVAEDWGGSTIFAPVSAKTGEGVEELLEMIILTAEILELKANANRNARGLVIEAELDKGKGSVATVLVQKGTLRVGDAIAAGSAFGRVRAMMDDKGNRIEEAGPSIPVEILGLNAVPNAGEVFVVCENDKEARTFGETFISQNRMKMLDETKSKSMSLDDIFNQIQAGSLKELPIIVKADVQGSVEAMKQSLLKISNEEVVVKVIHGGVGAINESDVILATASKAIIIGFNVRPDVSAKETADREGVDVRLYSVIYSAIEDVEQAMKGMLAPVFEEKVLGHAEVRQTFKASGVGTIAGSYVLDGTFERGCSVRVMRDDAVIFDGPLASLKRFKDDVKEVRAGYECGFVFEKFNDVQEEDKVEAYKMVEVPRK